MVQRKVWHFSPNHSRSAKFSITGIDVSFLALWLGRRRSRRVLTFIEYYSNSNIMLLLLSTWSPDTDGREDDGFMRGLCGDSYI